MKRHMRDIFYIVIILAVLVSQFGLLSIGATDVGAAPAQEPIPTNPSYMGVTLSNVQINGGSNMGAVTPGSTFSVSLDYLIVDTDCSDCIDQIQIGFSTGDPLAVPIMGSRGWRALLE